MNRTVLILLLVFSCCSIAQDLKYKQKKNSIAFSMGVNYINTPGYNEYLRNYIPYTNKDSISDFSVGFELDGSYDRKLSDNIKISVGYTYLTKSNSYKYLYYNYDLSYMLHKPSVSAYWFTENPYLSFDVGVGINYSFAVLTTGTILAQSKDFKANGIGFNLFAKFRPKLSERLSAVLTGKLFYDLIGVLKDDNGNLLIDNVTDNEVNLNNFGGTFLIGLGYNF